MLFLPYEDYEIDDRNTMSLSSREGGRPGRMSLQIFPFSSIQTKTF